MASPANVIKTLTIRSKVEGADKTQSDLKGIAAAHEAVAKVVDTSAKNQLSLEKSVAQAERRFNSALRAQQDFEKVQRQMNLAVAQNPALQDRANTVIAQAALHYGQAGAAAKAFAAATSGVSGQLIALSAGAGPVGVFLSALGPWGIAAAVGLGAAAAALHAMADGAHALAEKAQELRRFSEITGLSTAAVQALRSEASKFGVTSDEAQSAIQQFTARFNELRLGQGELLTQVRRLNPALADQMAATTDAGEALTLFGQALLKVDDIFQRNALVKAATGRGGLSAASFLSGLDVGRVTQGYVAAGKALDDNLIKKLAQLEIDIAKTTGKAKENFASIFAQDFLETQKRAADQFLQLSNIVKNFTISDDLKQLIAGPGSTGKLPGAFEPFGWLKTLIDLLPAIRNLQTGGLAATPRAASPTAAPIDTFASRFGFSSSGGTQTLPEFQLEKMKATAAAMGSASTAAQQLAIKEKELAIAAANAGLSQEQFNRALAVLRTESALSVLQRQIGLLGDLASVTDVVKAKQLEINLANAAGAGITKEQTAAILERTRLQVENAKPENQLRFERDMVFVLEEQRQIYERIRGLNIDINSARGQALAAEMRELAALKSIRDTVSSAAETFTKGFVSNLMQGKSAMDSMVLSARNLSQSLANQAITEAFKGNFIGAAASGIGALVSGIFGKKQTSEERRAIIQQQQQLAEEQARVAQEAADEQLRIAQEAADEQARVARDAAAEQLRIANELHDRQTSFQDRLFAAANDNTTLGGQLAAFDRQANREREQEAIAGNGAMIDLEAALAFERTRIQTDFNRKAVEAEQQAARQREDAINSAAKNILDYVQGLLAGPSSTLSPQARYTNAQAAYNTKLTAAIGGDVNAQSSITGDADNLLKAARDIYASSQTFQDLQQTVISQLLSLPAVSSTTDPLLQEMRNVLGAINAGNATQALDSTLTSVIVSAINAGNATATAAALSNSTLFQRIDTNTDNAISLGEMQAALGGMVNNAALVSMFTRLDTDNSGLVTAAELTAQRTGFITFNTDTSGGIARQIGFTADQALSTAQNVATSNQILDSINALQLTASQQLELLNFQLTGGTTAITLSTGGVDRYGNATPGISGSVNNNLITALNKIVVNTKLIADNTSFSATHIFAVGGSQNLGSPTSGIGTFAEGGTIPPYALGLVSEHLNPTFLRAGPEPIHVFPGSPSNDNSSAELRELKAEVIRLGAIIAGSSARVAQAVVESKDEMVDATDRQTNTLAATQRTSDGKRKVA